MATLSVLQKSLQEAQLNLLHTDNTIIKVTGRDPNQPRPPLRAGPLDPKARAIRLRSAEERPYEGAMAVKRRRESFGAFGRELHSEDDAIQDDEAGRKLSSSVQVTEVPPRPHGDPVAIDTKGKGKDRNRRMLGVLLGTLSRFKKEQEAIQQTGRDKRRQEIEQRLEQHAQLEKEEAAVARKTLYQQRKEQQVQVTKLEQKLMIAEMVSEWEEHDKLLGNFIRTNADPPIFYLPAHHNVATMKSLQLTKTSLEGKVKQRNAELLTDTDPVKDKNFVETVSMETVAKPGEGSGQVKSEIVVSPNKDIFEQPNEIDGKSPVRVCEVKPLPRDTPQPVTMETDSKGGEIDSSSDN